MRIILSKSTHEAVDTVTNILIDKLVSQPSIVIGLATGQTMEPVYENLVSKVMKDSIKMDKTFFFMLDEYLGIEENHPSSFKSYIKQRLLLPLNLKESQVAYPQVKHSGEAYERLIKEAGGIDLQLLGLGVNGHVGFNEPGSEINSRTRVVELTEETKNSNKIHFGIGEMPGKALSMGIGTIMEGKELLMLVTGKSKAEAIKYLLNHHDDKSCPVTFLKSHPHFTLVLDPDAASRISLKI